MADDVLKSLRVKFGADTKQYEAALRRAQKNTNAFSKNIKNLAGAVGIGFSIGAIVNFTRSAMQAYDVQAKAEGKLLQALNGRRDIQKELINQAQSLQGKTLFGDEEIIQMQAFTAAMGLSKKQIKEMIPAAMELSTVTGMSLESAIKNLNKTLSGTAGELGESVPALKELTKEELKAGGAIKWVNEQMGGQAEAAAQLGMGPWKQLTNVFGDLSEQAGNFIANGLNPMFKGLTNLLNPNKKLSESYREEQAELNRLVGMITNVNTSQEIRKKLIDDLDSRFPNFLGNLNKETVSNQQLAARLEDVNKQYLDKIKYMVMQERVDSYADKIAKTHIKELEYLDRIEKEKEKKRKYETKYEQEKADDIIAVYEKIIKKQLADRDQYQREMEKEIAEINAKFSDVDLDLEPNIDVDPAEIELDNFIKQNRNLLISLGFDVDSGSEALRAKLKDFKENFENFGVLEELDTRKKNAEEKLYNTKDLMEARKQLAVLGDIEVTRLTVLKDANQALITRLNLSKQIAELELINAPTNEKIQQILKKIKKIDEQIQQINTLKPEVLAQVEFVYPGFDATEEELQNMLDNAELSAEVDLDIDLGYESLSQLDIGKSIEEMLDLEELELSFTIDAEIETDGVKKDIKKLSDEIDANLRQAIKNVFTAFGEGLGNLFSDSDSGFESVIQSFTDFLKKFGELMIEYGVAKLVLDSLIATGIGAGAAIAAGIVLVAAATALSNHQNKASEKHSFAEGALAYTPVDAVVGDHTNRSVSNPEIITPLDKLEDILGGGGYKDGGEVTFRIQDRDLVGILRRYDKRKNVFS